LDDIHNRLERIGKCGEGSETRHAQVLSAPRRPGR
jgi:hypothetical protein